jgi:DNA repair exonuclease SbcCD ATPase subunit
MIEPIMFAGIGFLVAALLVLGFIPMVHGRAVRLTTRRLEALTPVSLGEIQAEKDQLRAEFAMSTRRLEMSVEQLKAKCTSQLADIGKKSDAIGRLKLDLGEKTAQLFALEAKERQLTEEVRGFEPELAGKTKAFEQTQRALADREAELAQLTAKYHEASVSAESQRVELVALRAQAEALKGQIESYEQEGKFLNEKLREKKSEAESLNNQLAAERARTEQLSAQLSDVEGRLIVEQTESEVRARRVQELTARLDEQSRFLADREFVSDKLREEVAIAQRAESELRAALAEAENRHRLGTQGIRGETGLLEEQLRRSEEERSKLQREIEGMRRDAETAWADERMENAVLRERINDVAAQVARLTASLEGPGSPIDTILKADAAIASASSHINNGASVSIAPAQPGAPKGSLAERIRALQNRASTVPQPNDS